MKDVMNGGGGVSSSSSRKQLQGATSSINGSLRPQAGDIRKNNNHKKPEDVQLILRRLKQYLLYSKLRSLIPSPIQQQQQQQQQPPFGDDHQLGGGRHEEEEEEATEVEMELHEIPIAYRSDSDHDHDHEETNTNIIVGNDHDHYDLVLLETKQEKYEDEEEEEEDNTCTGSTTIVFESDDEAEEKQSEKAFVPSVKIERMEDTILINTVVLKQKASTSSLFKLLEEEEEKLDIVFESQYRTETKVCHTIQVRLVQPTTAAAADQYINVDKLEKRLQKWAKGGEPAEPML